MQARLLQVLVCVLFLIRTTCADVVITQGTNFGVDVFPDDGRIAMDLLGKIWLLPARGGQARLMTDGLLPARQPRWSPDGSRILYQINAPDEASLWLLDVESSAASSIGNGTFVNQHASWHPDGERIVYSSQRGDSGFDIWETDLPTGLSWRISSHPGDEIEPVWSRDGRHLAYIRKNEEKYTLVLRRHGQAEIDLLVTDQPLSSLSWRPDGTLLTVFKQDDDGLSVYMVILAEPPLVRQLFAGEDIFAAPVSWRNRRQMLYTADGVIKTRDFAIPRFTELPFRATLEEPKTRPKTIIARHELEVIDPPAGRMVIRGSRLFDGIWNGYREEIDIVIDGGRIAEVAERRDWPDTTILDLGDVTILPGFIDLWSALPVGPAAQSGPGVLAYGVTTIVTDDAISDSNLWEGERTPGPRVLAASDVRVSTEQGAERDYFFVKVPARDAGDNATREAVQNWQAQGVPVLAENWNTGLAIGADLLVGAGSLPSSPVGGQYQDMQVTARQGPVTLVSGLADAGTPGIASLLDSRQARELGHGKFPGRRFSSVPALGYSAASILLGSKPNGLPPGLALHAELRALGAAGLQGERILRATGSGAATVLGLDNQIGRITPGALADLVLVNGDPLKNATDALSIVAVVRNGRFFSLVGLLERATAETGVE